LTLLMQSHGESWIVEEEHPQTVVAAAAAAVAAVVLCALPSAEKYVLATVDVIK